MKELDSFCYIKTTFIKKVDSVTMYELFKSDINSKNLSEIYTLDNNLIQLILTNKNGFLIPQEEVNYAE